MVTRRSAILTGQLRHRRLRPRAHRFTSGVYHALLDLDELPVLDREVRGFGYRRRAATTFHDTDHLGPADRPVKEKLRTWLEAHGVALPDGPVLLLTNLRVLGYVFNPVSWFLCYRADGELELIVAEVHNTFGDTYLYLLQDLDRDGPHRVVARARKRLHVSPFMDVPGHEYRFVFRPPPVEVPIGALVAVHMDVHDAEGKLFDATVAERVRRLTTGTLWAVLARYPLMTLRTIVAIHWQALRLWRKGVPFFRRPEPPDTGLAAAHGAAPRGAGSEPAHGPTDDPELEHAS